MRDQDNDLTNIFPPFEPDDKPQKERLRRLRPIQYRVILPNLITLLAICAGLTGVRLGFEGKFDWAIAALLLAAFFDGIDGQVARALKSTSRFGAELDSLADFVNFGAAPALILYLWTLQDLNNLGWVTALIFASCMAMRLARFNASLDTPDVPEFKKKFFVGVPAPAGAFLGLFPLYLDHVIALDLQSYPGVTLLFTLIVAMLVVSNIPTLTTKQFGKRMNRAYVMPALVFILATIALGISYPWPLLTILGVAYLISIPITRQSYIRQAKRHYEKSES